MGCSGCGMGQVVQSPTVYNLLTKFSHAEMSDWPAPITHMCSLSVASPWNCGGNPTSSLWRLTLGGGALLSPSNLKPDAR